MRCRPTTEREAEVFIAGNDAGAKATVTALLTSFGHTDILDLGDLSGARGTEMLLPIWLRLMATTATAGPCPSASAGS